MRSGLVNEIYGIDVTFRTERKQMPGYPRINVLTESEHINAFKTLGVIGSQLFHSYDRWKFGNVLLALSDPYKQHNSTQYVKTNILGYDSDHDLLTIYRPEANIHRTDIYGNNLYEAKIPTREVLFAVANVHSEAGKYYVDDSGMLALYVPGLTEK